MPIHPIRTSADHERAIARIAELIGAQQGSAAADELDILATLDTYHTQIAQKLTPEHRAAYEAAMADHKKELGTLLQADQGSSEGGSRQ